MHQINFRFSAFYSSEQKYSWKQFKGFCFRGRSWQLESTVLHPKCNFWILWWTVALNFCTGQTGWRAARSTLNNNQFSHKACFVVDFQGDATRQRHGEPCRVPVPHHLLVNLKSFTYNSIGEDTDIFFSLFDLREGKTIRWESTHSTTNQVFLFWFFFDFLSTCFNDFAATTVK